MKKTQTLSELWKEKAKQNARTIVLPEAYFSKRVLDAGLLASTQKIAKIILLTDNDEFISSNNIVENEYLKVVNIKTHEIREMLSSALYEKRKEKGISKEGADVLIQNSVYFGTMMVDLGLADGLVAGAEIATAETFKPAFQIIKGKTKDTKISSFFVMTRDDETYILSDCGVNINPTAEEIVEIAKLSAESARVIGGLENPKVALLSYSTLGSAEGDDAVKMRTAKELLKTQNIKSEILDLVKYHHQNLKRSGYPVLENSELSDIGVQIV